MSRVPDLILLSGLSHPETEEYFGKELDDHCVLLESTPKLQDKAMRIDMHTDKLADRKADM